MNNDIERYYHITAHCGLTPVSNPESFFPQEVGDTILTLSLGQQNEASITIPLKTLEALRDRTFPKDHNFKQLVVETTGGVVERSCWPCDVLLGARTGGIHLDSAEYEHARDNAVSILEEMERVDKLFSRGNEEEAAA